MVWHDILYTTCVRYVCSDNIRYSKDKKEKKNNTFFLHVLRTLLVTRWLSAFLPDSDSSPEESLLM